MPQFGPCRFGRKILLVAAHRVGNTLPTRPVATRHRPDDLRRLRLNAPTLTLNRRGLPNCSARAMAALRADSTETPRVETPRFHAIPQRTFPVQRLNRRSHDLQ